MITISLARNWFILGADVSTAFLHANWSGEEVFVWPIEEFYPGGGVFGDLKRHFTA